MRVLFLLGLMVLGCENIRCATLVHFQTKGVPDAVSHLRAKSSISIPSITAFTLCFHVRLLRIRYMNTVISYGAENSTDELCFVFTDLNEVHFWGFQGRVNLHYRLQELPTRVWMHFCMLLNTEDLSWWFVLDGVMVKSQLDLGNLTSVIPGGGGLVVGQEQDSLFGEFNPSQSLNGELAGLALYDYIVPQNELDMFMKCEEIVGTPIVSFQNFENDFEIFGDVEKKEVDLKTLCVRKEYFDLVLPEKRDFNFSALMCSIFGGIIQTPVSEDDNLKTYLLTKKFEPQCNEIGHGAWLGISYSPRTNSWYYYDSGKPITYSKIPESIGKLSDVRLCASLFLPASYNRVWFERRCYEQRCVICRIPPQIRYRVRGLCRRSRVDKEFFLDEMRGIKALFSGINLCEIDWDNDTWKLRSLSDNSLFGEMVMHSEMDYPSGLNTWTIYGDVCSAQPQEVKQLMMTSCPIGSFTCNDGYCINIEERCDLQKDCPDASDEKECQLVAIPEEYAYDLPPPRRDRLTPVEIRASIEVIRVREIDILDMQFTLDVCIHLKWHDPRLTYHNLKADMMFNSATYIDQELWTPDLRVDGDGGSAANLILRSRHLWVLREDSPQPDDVSRAREDELFSGELNSLYLRIEYTANFSCMFDLADYPFDLQVGKILFRFQTVTSTLAVLKTEPEDLRYLGNRRLLEYEVGELSLDIDTLRNYSLIRVTIPFRNLYRYYITNTYVPTTLLVTITYLTFFFRVDDFSDQVMVSLTALLVLATLFSQTSSSIPKTSYLKLIDIWFVFVICFDFVMVVLLVFINYIQEEDPKPLFSFKMYPVERNLLSSQKAKRLSSKNQPCGWCHGPKHELLNRASKTLLPVLGLLFITIYMVLCSTGL